MALANSLASSASALAKLFLLVDRLVQLVGLADDFLEVLVAVLLSLGQVRSQLVESLR